MVNRAAAEGSHEATGQRRRHPRLASDEFRQWISALVAGVLITLTMTVLGFLVGFGVIPIEAGRMLFSTHVVLTSLGMAWFYVGIAYAIFTGVFFGRYRGAELRRIVRETDPRHRPRRNRLLLYLSLGDEISFPLAAVLMALAGVVWLVVQPAFADTAVLVLPALAGLVGGWLMLIVSFALSYLREWASNDSVRFPDGGESGDRATDRRYSDFIYVATQFATTFSSADADLAGPRVRTLATLNAIVAFLFSTVIVGIFLSIAVSTSSA